MSSTKAGAAERVIRTIKSRLEKYFTLNKTKRYVDVIDNMVENYNNSPHKRIGMSPSNVSFDNADIVFKKAFPQSTHQFEPRLGRGDRVRILRDKSIFEKGYTANWSNEVYIIKSVHSQGNVCWYKLETLQNIDLQGIYYYHQLNLVLKK